MDKGRLKGRLSEAMLPEHVVVLSGVEFGVLTLTEACRIIDEEPDEPVNARLPFALAEAIAEYITESGRPCDATFVWDAIQSDEARAAIAAASKESTL
jgi:hypothetical protein